MKYLKEKGKVYSVRQEVNTAEEVKRIDAEIAEHDRLYQKGMEGLKKRRDEAVVELEKQKQELINL